jgi:hypothetical protein
MVNLQYEVAAGRQYPWVRERTISTMPESRLPVSIIFKIFFLNFTINALEQAT